MLDELNQSICDAMMETMDDLLAAGGCTDDDVAEMRHIVGDEVHA